MRVTVLADASHCPDTKAGGYGYWIASERGRKGGSGPLKGKILTSTLAELMSVANAVYEGVSHGLIHPKDVLLIQIDCESAIFAFTGKRKASEAEQAVVRYIATLSISMQLTIEYRHVKGHSSRSESRFAANRKCDREARKEMRKVRVNMHLQNARELLETSRIKNETIS